MNSRDLEMARTAVAEAEERIQRARYAVRETGILREMGDAIQMMIATWATALETCAGMRRKPHRPAYA